jgi:iron complex outermembrane recepter protein
MKKLACSACFVLVGVAPAAADNNAEAPKSLRMRERTAASSSHWNPLNFGRRVAQATAPDQPVAPEPPPMVDQPAPADAPPAAPEPAAQLSLTDEELAKLAEAEAKTEVITVTGSTIERKTLTTPAPVTIMTRADLNAAGRATVGDILQSLPAQSNGINAQTNNGGDGSTRVDLRGLGTNRTLVLLNGRRMVPGGTGANASVDLNTIPLAVIERVEVLKDGASAIYGSDAIGGVVNVITRADFNGSEAAIFTSTSQRGDGTSYDASFVTGYTSEGKRGNVVFSAGYQQQDSVFAGDRDFSTTAKTYNFATQKEGVSGSSAPPWGRIDRNQFDRDGDGQADVVLGADGKPVLDDKGNPTPIPVEIAGCTQALCRTDGANGWKNFGNDVYNFAPANYLFTPSSRYNMFSTGNYRLTDSVKATFEALYLHRNSDQLLAPQPFLADVNISKDNVYNMFGGDLLDYRRRLEEFGPRRFIQSNDTFRIVTGIEGKVPEDVIPALKDWKYEASFNYGRTASVESQSGQLIKSRLANALGPSMMDASGKPICVTTPGDPRTAIAGCVPLNILGPSGSIQADQIPYLTYTGVQNGFSDQMTMLTQAHGRIAKLPNNGDISLAVGGDYRRESGGQTPDPLTATGDTTGNASQPTNGSYNVLEGFGELSVVPISGNEIAQWVELNFAARAFRYSTFGSGVTYKAGGLFRTVNGIAVRGTYSTAFRAPSISDLYSGRYESNPAIEDPCDTTPPSLEGEIKEISPNVRAQCLAQGVPNGGAPFGTAQQLSQLGGNPLLKAETADVATVGVVLEPPQVKGLSLTADYWRVKITDAIQTLGPAVIFANCYDRGVQEYCDKVQRDPISHKIKPVDDFLLNVGGTSTSGMDFAVGYDTKLGDIGRIKSQIEAQYLFQYDVDNTLTVDRYRGFYSATYGPMPKYKANLSSLWAHPSGAGGGFTVRFVGKFKECDKDNCNNPDNLAFASRDVDRYFKADLYGTYDFKTAAGKTSVQVGVNNVLDADPPVLYNAFANNSDSTTYDYMGRLVYARLSQAF